MLVRYLFLLLGSESGSKLFYVIDTRDLRHWLFIYASPVGYFVKKCYVDR